MNFKNQRLLRSLIFLLTTVFLMDTVYANGMMIDSQMSMNNAGVADKYLEANHDEAHSEHHHDAHSKQSSASGCSECSHCMACFSVLPPNQVSLTQLHTQQMASSLHKPSYVSHVSARLQRPPIS